MTIGVIILSLKKEHRRRFTSDFPNPAFEPMIELVSNREAVVEGCAGIVEYNDSSVTVNCRKTTVTIEGSCINLKALSTDTIEITGTFTCIKFSCL